MKKYILYLLLICGTLSVAGQSNGDWQTRASGNWNSNTVWQIFNGTTWDDATSGQYPTNRITNNITIQSHTITATGDIVQDNSSGTTLQINSGGILNMGSNNLTGEFFFFVTWIGIGYSDLIVNGTLNSAGGYVDALDFSIGSDGHFLTDLDSDNGWWTLFPTLTSDFQGLIEFSGTDQDLPNYTYTDLTINGTTDIASGTRTINGKLKVIGTLTNAARIDLADSLINSGSITSTEVMDLGGSILNSGTLISSDSVYLAGNLINNVGGSITSSAPMILSGDVTNNATITNTDFIDLSGDMTNNSGGQITTEDSIIFDGDLTNIGTISTSAAALFIFTGGNDTISGSGSFPSSNLNLDVGKGAVASYTITSPSEITVYDMWVRGNDTLNMDPNTKLTVTNRLRVWNDEGGFRINSNATSSGSVIAADYSGGGQNGISEYRRYISGGEWHIMSSPLPGETIGAGFITNNSDSLSYKIATTEYAMATYDEASGGWTSFYQIGETGTMTAGQGFLGRRDNAGILTYSGDMSVSTVNIGIGRTSNGWNSVGNPYTSAIGITTDASTTPDDFLTVNSAQLDPSYAALYIFDPATPTSYQILNNSGSGGGYVDQDYLLPGQGFLVKAKTGGGTVSFTQAMQLHNGTESYYKKSAQSNTMWPTITLFVNTEDAEAYTDIKFRYDMTPGLDVTYDAALFATDPKLSIYSKLMDGHAGDFAIQCLPDAGPESFIIPLGVDYPDGGEIVFSTQNINLLPGQEVILEDRETGQFTDLLFEGSEYRVSVPIETTGTGRFYLHTTNESTSNSDLNNLNDFSIFAIDKNIHVDGFVEESCDAYLFDMTGRVTEHFTLFPGYSNVLSANEVMTGVYILSIRDRNGTHSEKIFLK